MGQNTPHYALVQVARAEDRWGELRSLLQVPCEQSWRKLCKLLGTWPDARELQEAVVPYCAAALERAQGWTHPLRRAPDTWLYTLFEQVPVYTWGMTAWMDRLKRRHGLGHTLSERLVQEGYQMNPIWQLVRTLELGMDGDSLFKWEIGDEGARVLFHSPQLSCLRVLNLWDNWISDRGVTELVRSATMTALEVLDLSENRITDEGAIALASSPKLRRITSLNLRNNLLTERGERAIMRSPYLNPAAQLEL